MKDPWQKLLVSTINSKRAVRPEGFYTVRDIMVRTNQSRACVYRFISQLIKAGKIEKKKIRIVVGDKTRIFRASSAYRIL